MHWRHSFPRPRGVVVVRLPTGEEVRLPLFDGLLKHPPPEELAELLLDHRVARKYTIEALAHAPWPVLRHFPAGWLRSCMEAGRAPLGEGRRRALEFLL